MLGQLEGNAILACGGNERIPVLVTFDVEKGTCNVRAPEGTHPLYLLSTAASAASIHLEDVGISSSIGHLHASRLGPFSPVGYLRNTTERDDEIASSTLARLLEVSPESAPHTSLILLPHISRLDLELRSDETIPGCEALFYCDPPVKFRSIVRSSDLELKVHTFHPGTDLARYVRCACATADRFEHISNKLRIALSLFFRRRAFLHFLRQDNRVALNLAQPDRALSYGVLVKHAPQRFEETLQRLMTFNDLLQPFFLIEAFSNPAAIDVRYLNAFVHLEIVDESGTLSANRLSSILDIERNDADALIYVRNAMVHEGKGIKDALESARLKLHSRGRSTSRVLEESLRTPSPHGEFYCALMDLLTTHLAKQVGIPLDWLWQRGRLSFQSS